MNQREEKAFKQRLYLCLKMKVWKIRLCFKKSVFVQSQGQITNWFTFSLNLMSGNHLYFMQLFFSLWTVPSIVSGDVTLIPVLQLQTSRQKSANSNYVQKIKHSGIFLYWKSK